MSLSLPRRNFNKNLSLNRLLPDRFKYIRQVDGHRMSMANQITCSNISADFSGLPNLCVLGLINVTTVIPTIPEDTEDRRDEQHFWKSTTWHMALLTCQAGKKSCASSILSCPSSEGRRMSVSSRCLTGSTVHQTTIVSRSFYANILQRRSRHSSINSTGVQAWHPRHTPKDVPRAEQKHASVSRR
jgi:hypothetical protein